MKNNTIMAADVLCGCYLRRGDEPARFLGPDRRVDAILVFPTTLDAQVYQQHIPLAAEFDVRSVLSDIGWIVKKHRKVINHFAIWRAAQPLRYTSVSIAQMAPLIQKLLSSQKTLEQQ